MTLDWLDPFLITGLFSAVMVVGLALLLHLQMGLARIANFGVVGFWGLRYNSKPLGSQGIAPGRCNARELYRCQG